MQNEAKVDEICWELCKSNYIERDNPLLPDDCVYMLFRIFCMLGDMVENDKGMPEVVMAAAEVENAAFRYYNNFFSKIRKKSVKSVFTSKKSSLKKCNLTENFFLVLYEKDELFRI